MGSSKSTLLTPGSLKKAERELLEYGGIFPSDYQSKKVAANEDGSLMINTILVGNLENPTLVLVHGFGGSGAMYYRVIKGLAENFYLIIIDLPGMGSSSRPTWTARNGIEADQFFMSAIETWRINMGDLTNFYVAAHSYGGYIFGTYASIHPQHIRKLLLLSPLGVKEAPLNFSLSKMRW